MQKRRPSSRGGQLDIACPWFISQPIMFSAGAVTDRGVKMIYVNRFPCMEKASSKAKWASAMQAARTLLCEPRGYTAHMERISSGL
jgi:hypothetical protein